MNQSVKAALAFVLIMAVVFAALYLYRYGLPRAQVAPSDSSSGSSTATTTASSSNSSSTGSSIVSVSASSAVNTAIGYITKAGDLIRSLIEWLISSVKDQSLNLSIIKGMALSAAFFIAGYLVHLVARFIRFIFYGLGVITIVITALIVIGLL